jgi:hypothetical protein
VNINDFTRSQAGRHLQTYFLPLAMAASATPGAAAA